MLRRTDSTRTLAVAAAIGAAIALAADAAQAQPSLEPTWLEGTVGDAKVRMYLDSPFAPDIDAVYGVYYYVRYGEPIVLSTLPGPEGSLVLGACEPCHTADRVDRFLLKVGPADAPSVAGTWTSADGTRTLPVKLRRVGEFVDSDRTTRLEKFADKRWPIEFMYPAGWLVTVTPRELVIRAPDPEDMLWRNGMACEQGRGLPDPPAPGEEPVEFHYPFFRTSSGWQIETPFDLDPPTLHRHQPRMLMSAAVAYKGGPLWPFPGIFEEMRHLALSGDRWVTCTERLRISDERMNLRLTRSR